MKRVVAAALVTALAAMPLAVFADLGYGKQKVVYHVNYDDPKHQAAAMRNIQNHINAVGAENLNLKVVLHGKGLSLLLTPDMAPIMDGNDPIEGYYMDCGWGYFGFKSCAATGKYMAQFMASGNCPDMLKPFSLRRFEQHRLMGETAALVNYTPDN